MQRAEFLELCQKVSVLTNKSNNPIPGELLVTYNGIKYYPVSYELSFDAGQPMHYAILHDLKANSIIKTLLSSVQYMA
jgi:hypothetical protein